MKEIIRGSAKNVRSLLAYAKYEIDFYQREYLWEQKHVYQLLDDLESTFERSWKQHDGSPDVHQYERYFLGSIIISEARGARSIVDGQQRLTTVTLILLALYHKLAKASQRDALAQLIYSYQVGGESFNLHVEDRVACMKALFERGEFTDDSPSQSAANMKEQYEHLEAYVDGVVGRPESDEGGPIVAPDPDPERLQVFADWLMLNVYFVEVAAAPDEAYAIFETMNDRGLPLAPVDLLKSYLLSQIDGRDVQGRMNETWKGAVAELRREIDDQAPAWAIKGWLRSQYAEGASGTGREAPPDFTRIDLQLHRWVRDERDRLGLHASADFQRFIERDFTFYMRWYKRIREASRTWTRGLESVYRNDRSHLRDRDYLYLAPLEPDEDEQTSLRKIRTVAAFIELLIAERAWHGWKVNYKTMDRSTEKLTVDIRRGSAPDIANAVSTFPRLEFDFKPRPGGVMGRGKSSYTHRFLARMTEFIEVESGLPSRFAEYVQAGREGYDVEHIWANHWSRHGDEFPQEKQFDDFRNWMGGLVLLPHSTNIELGDSPYADKRTTYSQERQNLLVRSLVTEPPHVPGFGEFVERSGLPFRRHAEFRKADIEARTDLYRQLAQRIWSLDGIRRIAESVGRVSQPAGAPGAAEQGRMSDAGDQGQCEERPRPVGECAVRDRLLPAQVSVGGEACRPAAGRPRGRLREGLERAWRGDRRESIRTVLPRLDPRQ